MAKTPNPEKQGRIAQIRQAYRSTKHVDPAIAWLLPLVFFGVTTLITLLGWWLLTWPLGFFFGLPLATLLTMWLFGTRAERAAYASIAGQPGAAVAALNQLRKGWYTTPFIEVTKQQDSVHRVVGPPGIVLVAEAPASRAPQLLAATRAKVQRYAADVPIHELVAGDDGIPLRKLSRKVMRLPRALRGPEVAELRRKLDAVQKGPSLPIPRGPLPKNMRMPRPKKM